MIRVVASVVLTVFAAASAGADATPRRWPQPAAGPSRSGDPEILFTFDDGPHENFTPRILDALRMHGVQAIFFVAGWRLSGRSADAERRRAAARRALADGHALGNHTIAHARMCTIRRPAAARQLDDNNALLAALSGMPVAFYRNPYGSRCRQVEELLAERGLEHLHWDIDPREYLHHDPAKTKSYLIRKLSRLRGRAVILLHDTQWPTARVLPEVLDWIAQENARRRADGERPIRILSYADLVRERLPAGWLRLLDRSSALARSFAPDVATRLVLRLAPRVPTYAPAQARTFAH